MLILNGWYADTLYPDEVYNDQLVLCLTLLGLMDAFNICNVQGIDINVTSDRLVPHNDLQYTVYKLLNVPKELKAI